MNLIKKEKTVVVTNEVYSTHVELTKKEASILFVLLNRPVDNLASHLNTDVNGIAKDYYNLWKKFFSPSDMNREVAYKHLGID